MIRYVLDASVAAKWFLAGPGEDLVEQAVRLLRLYTAGGAEFIVPDLFFAEFAAVLGKAERLGRCDRQATDRAVAEVLGWNLRTFPTASLLRRAVAISRAWGCSLYDAVYLSLAEQATISMITADERLVRAVGGRLPVLWLGALP